MAEAPCAADIDALEACFERWETSCRAARRTLGACMTARNPTCSAEEAASEAAWPPTLER